MKIKSIADFYSCIEALKKYKPIHKDDKLIFRGQSNIDWDITSSAYRDMHENYPTIKISPIIIETFKDCVSLVSR